MDREIIKSNRNMRTISSLSRRDNVISLRASTEERMRAEQLMQQLNLSSHGALVRQLIQEKAQALGVI
jgi:hypothetical protein